MTNRDRDAVAELVKQIAARLMAAPQETEARARTCTESTGEASRAAFHQVGGLEQICKQEAHALTRLVENMLTPKAPKPRASARGKR